MVRMVPATIKILDLPEFKAFVAEVETRIVELERDRDEWKHLYENLVKLAERRGALPR